MVTRIMDIRINNYLQNTTPKTRLSNTNPTKYRWWQKQNGQSRTTGKAVHTTHNNENKPTP